MSVFTLTGKSMTSVYLCDLFVTLLELILPINAEKLAFWNMKIIIGA